MARETKLQSLSDDELLQRLSELLKQSRRVEAVLIAHIGEVDHRRLYTREACSSMFTYCVELLNLSEAEAYLRITVARASRSHPELVEMLADGRIHLSGIAKLVPHLTQDNVGVVLERATHKSKRQIEELIAELAPRPDAPAAIRKLPAPRKAPPMTPGAQNQLRPDGVVRAPAQAPPAPKPEPLAPSRYKVQFTASAELRDKLERLTALVQSSEPDADLADVIDAAITEKLERLEAKRIAKTRSPRKDLAQTDTRPSSRHVPAAVRRVVYERDAGRCTFVSAEGKRCGERTRLEFHHETPFARGGGHEPDNVRLLCRVHNGYEAELDYGKEVMGRYRLPTSHVREPKPVYFLGPEASAPLSEGRARTHEASILMSTRRCSAAC